MFVKVAKRNLAAQKSRTILTTIGVAIGTAALVGVFAFSNGLRAAVIESITSRGPLTQITVQPRTNEGTFLRALTPAPSDTLTPETLKEVEQIPHVESVLAENSYANISSVRLSILGQGFQTDAMLFGVPFEFLVDELDESAQATLQEEWSRLEEPYPAIVSQRIVDLYNLTVAPTNNLPNFSEKDIIGLEFDLMPGTSTFFPQLSGQVPSIRAKVAGFSKKVELIGVTLPFEAIKKINSEHYPDDPETYLKLFVNVDKEENVAAVTKAVEEIDLVTSSTSEEIQIFENNFRIVTVGLSLIGAIILVIAGLTIASTFLSAVNERRHEIGIMRAIGATKKQIRNIFLVEAAIMGLFGGIFGIIFAWLGGFIVDAIALNAFPDVSSKPDTLLIYDYWLLAGATIFAIIISTIFAYLPAAKAARLEPLEALSE